MIKTELHIFTNVMPTAPSTVMIRDTYRSFKNTFGLLTPIIWCDPKPKIRSYQRYKKNLQKNFPKIIETTSLSDGYIKAIKRSEADYLFMLEHDWIFNDNISHSLREIIDLMKAQKIYHFRFNKRKNEIRKWDKKLVEVELENFIYCLTPILSNNPHIIERKSYLTFMRRGLIQIMPGSKGIEEIISKHQHTVGAIYGGLDYPATITHQDGRKRK